MRAIAAIRTQSAMESASSIRTSDAGTVRSRAIFFSLPSSFLLQQVMIRRDLARVIATYKTRISSEAFSRSMRLAIALRAIVG